MVETVTDGAIVPFELAYSQLDGVPSARGSAALLGLGAGLFGAAIMLSIRSDQKYVANLPTQVPPPTAGAAQFIMDNRWWGRDPGSFLLPKIMSGSAFTHVVDFDGWRHGRTHAQYDLVSSPLMAHGFSQTGASSIAALFVWTMTMSLNTRTLFGGIINGVITTVPQLHAVQRVYRWVYTAMDALTDGLESAQGQAKALLDDACAQGLARHDTHADWYDSDLVSLAPRQIHLAAALGVDLTLTSGPYVAAASGSADLSDTPTTATLFMASKSVIEQMAAEQSTNTRAVINLMAVANRLLGAVELALHDLGMKYLGAHYVLNTFVLNNPEIWYPQLTVGRDGRVTGDTMAQLHYSQVRRARDLIEGMFGRTKSFFDTRNIQTMLLSSNLAYRGQAGFLSWCEALDRGAHAQDLSSPAIPPTAPAAVEAGIFSSLFNGLMGRPAYKHSVFADLARAEDNPSHGSHTGVAIDILTTLNEGLTDDTPFDVIHDSEWVFTKPSPLKVMSIPADVRHKIATALKLDPFTTFRIAEFRSAEDLREQILSRINAPVLQLTPRTVADLHSAFGVMRSPIDRARSDRFEEDCAAALATLVRTYPHLFSNTIVSGAPWVTLIVKPQRGTFQSVVPRNGYERPEGYKDSLWVEVTAKDVLRVAGKIGHPCRSAANLAYLFTQAEYLSAQCFATIGPIYAGAVLSLCVIFEELANAGMAEYDDEYDNGADVPSLAEACMSYLRPTYMPIMVPSLIEGKVVAPIDADSYLMQRLQALEKVSTIATDVVT